MKVFITGATGFIGVHLTKKLVKQGYEVTALLRTPSKGVLLPKEVAIIKGDMSIFENHNLELPEFDVVIHLAGAIFAKSPEEYLKYNCEVTKDLVHCLENQKWKLKRFLYASSLAAGGPSENVAVDETSIPNPIDPYGAAKLAAEQFLQTVTAFPTTSFRPTIVLGPGDENSLTLFQMAQKRLGMTIDGKPQKLNFIDVDDLNDAIILMLQDTSKENKIYYVSHPDKITSIDIFEQLGEIMGHKVWMIPIPKLGLTAAMKISTFASELFGFKNQLDIKQHDQLIHDFECSSALLQKELDWKPKYNLKQTLSKAYKGYKESGKL